MHEVEEEASTSLIPTTTSQNKRFSRPNNKRNKTDSLANDVLLSVREHFKKPPTVEDRYDLFGRTVAMRMRGLEKRQSLIVEKQINDLLFEAELGITPTPMRTNVGRVDHQSGSTYNTSSGNASPAYTDLSHSTNSSQYQLQDESRSGGNPPLQEAQEVRRGSLVQLFDLYGNCNLEC